jgi:hypothetical protein
MQRRDFAVVVANGELGTVTAIVKEQTVALLCTGDEPLQSLRYCGLRGPAVDEQPNLSALESARRDEEIRHVSDIVHAAMQRLSGICIDTHKECSVCHRCLSRNDL